jgi:hypothetical protein
MAFPFHQTGVRYISDLENGIHALDSPNPAVAVVSGVRLDNCLAHREMVMVGIPPRFYTFCNERDGMVAYAPMWVSTFQEAKAAMVASSATFYTCAVEWKKPLDQLRGKIPPPPPGFTEPVCTQ